MRNAETLKQVEETSRKRLFPSIADPSWLVLRQRRKIFQRWLESITKENLAVLDVGGRVQPYRKLLGTGCANYIAIDPCFTPLVNIVARAQELPFADESFDLILCTQVLEYIPDPALAISEIYRTLKKGGFLLSSAPSVFPRDSEIEYWRFLPLSFKHLLARFSEVEVVAEGNSLIGLIRTINVCLTTFAKPRIFRELLRTTVVPVLNIFGALIEYAVPSRDDRFSANFSCMAQK